MEEMNCKSVRESLWDFMAENLQKEEREKVSRHVEDCRDCNLHLAEVRSLRLGFKGLPRKDISPLRSTVKLAFDNLLRPIAVPAAGGILASMFCFVVIVDTLHVHADWDNDIPIGLYTNVILDEATPFSVSGQDVIVQLTVDSTGKVSDFNVPSGNASSDEMREIGNLVLYSSFIPATAFGQRVSGKILVGINHINVRD